MSTTNAVAASWVPRQVRKHEHACFLWKPFRSTPWTIGVVVAKYRRDIRLERHPGALAWFREGGGGQQRPGLLGVVAFSRPDLNEKIVTHELLHAMSCYARRLRTRGRRIPREIREVEPRKSFQREEILAYGIEQAPTLFRELKRLASPRKKISKK